MGIIYKITSIDTGKVYIGQTIRGIKARFGQHVAMANSKYISPKEGSIQEAIRQYGADRFTVEILENCDNELLSEREKHYINLYDSYNKGYNMNSGGAASTSRYISYEDVLLMISNGYSPTEIASRFGCSLTKIANIARAYGLDINRKSPSSWKIRVVQYSPDFTPIRIHESITAAFRNTGGFGVSESTFQHSVRTACGTNEILYGNRWNKLDDLLLVINGEVVVARCILDVKNYNEGKSYTIKENVLYTDISNMIQNRNKCRFCGKELQENETICSECKLKHPRCAENKLEKENRPKQPLLKSRLPGKDVLAELIKTHTYIDICRMYNVHEKTLRDQLKEYGIYERRIRDSSNIDEIQVILDVISFDVPTAAKRAGSSKWKIKQILDKWEIPLWMYNNSRPVKATDPVTGSTYVFESCAAAVKDIIDTSDKSTSALNSYRYKIGKAAKEHREYLGYIWNEIDKQQILAEVSKIISEKGGQNL